MIKAILNYKFPYVIYNFFNKNKLKHNIPLFEKYGLKKKYYSSISSEDFKDIKVDERKINLDKIHRNKFYQNLNEENKTNIQSYDKNGYAIIRGFITEEKADSINKEIDDLISNGTLKFKYVNKLMFAIHHSDLIKNIGNDATFLEFLSILMDGKAKLFQSINFLKGSQQKTHSDSIHMTTFPLGGLIGVWIALEDIDLSQGALHYYPGTHKLPYYMNTDYGNKGTFLKIGTKDYVDYEQFLAKKVEEMGIKKEVFRAKKGDMLIWHANILHGGEPHIDQTKSRKSMVFHYFDEESICYHEVTQRPALFEP